MEFRAYNPDPSDPIQNDKRGYRVVKVEAVIEGEVVGYIKAAYIPREEWELKIPTKYHFAHLFNGDSRFKPYLKTGNPLDLYRACFPYSKLPASLTQLKKQVRRGTRRLLSSMNSNRDFLVDKPYVDYIRVTRKREGIGTALYLEMARVLAEMGFVLYASGMQSDEAKSVWASMKDRGYPVTTIGERVCLDLRAPLPSLP